MICYGSDREIRTTKRKFTGGNGSIKFLVYGIFDIRLCDREILRQMYIRRCIGLTRLQCA